jgi:hypothetical protein
MIATCDSICSGAHIHNEPDVHCRRLHEMRLTDRLEHDERLEGLLAQLHGRPGAEVDQGVLEDISNIARRRCIDC